jgi:hypothetical protein
MSRLLAVVALALIVVPSSLAKGPDSAEICGESRCVIVRDVDKVNALSLVTSGFATRAEPTPAPFLTVELTSSRNDGVNWSFVYVPSTQALKIVHADFGGGIAGAKPIVDEWVSPQRAALAAYADATAGLEPFAADAEWAVASDENRFTPWAFVAALIAASVLLLILGRRLGPWRAWVRALISNP